jgi:ATP synthase I subunit
MQDEEQRERRDDADAPLPHSTNETLSGAPEDEPDEIEDPEFAAPEHLELSPAEAASEAALCSQTLRRIERMILVAGMASAAAALWPLGGAVAVGLLLGSALGWINFRWLAASVNAIADRIVKAQSRERGAVIVARGVGRIGLIALFAYGIFECSVRGLMGFLAGLAMPVVAMMCEAAYEFVVSIRRPS